MGLTRSVAVRSAFLGAAALVWGGLAALPGTAAALAWGGLAVLPGTAPAQVEDGASAHGEPAPESTAVPMVASGGASLPELTVVSVSVEAEVLPSGDARVRMRYVLAGAQPGVPVPATLLAFGETAFADLAVARSGGDGVDPIPLTAEGSRRHTAVLPHRPADAGHAEVQAEYTVARAVSGSGDALRVQVPVLSVDAAPEDSRPGFFTARVTVPGGWAISETFPTAMARVDDAGDGAVYGADLPVVPATLSLRARTDAGWHPGLPLLLDVFTLLVVAAFSFVGWRYLRDGAVAT